MKEVNLHLGCGNVHIPGYIHIDMSTLPHIDYSQSIMSLPQFNDETVDLIYCCHALEYFDRYGAHVALKEWYRVLKENGVIRLAVPDFDKIIRVYMQHNNLSHRGILGPLYGKMLVNGRNIYHRTVSDFESLVNILESVGFRYVHRYDWRKTEHANVDDFSQAYVPHMDKENGILISLNIEAKK